MLNLGKILDKKVIFVFVIALLLIAGGVFWWQGDKIESFLESKKLERMVASSKDYSMVEESSGKFIINEKDGFKIKVPANWESEIGIDMSGSISEKNVTLYSQNFSYRPPNGCLIELEISRLQKRRVEKYNGDLVIYPIEGAEEVKEMINRYGEAKTEEKEGIKIISVDQKDALQETRILEGGIGKHVSIKIPTVNKVYIFEYVLFSKECDEQLDQFLETVSIQPR